MPQSTAFRQIRINCKMPNMDSQSCIALIKGNKVVTWPAIIKHTDDSELIFVSDQTVWNDVADLHSLDYEEAGYLIDSCGNIFTLTSKGNKHVNPEPNGDSMGLYEILGLVKAHAAQQGACCVAKLYAPTIIDAFKIVESLVVADY